MWKRIISGVVFCLAAMVASGKGEVTRTRLQALYSNAEMLDIEKVVFSDTATVLHFTAQGKVNSSFQFAASTYLSDEAGTRHPLKGASGLEVGKPCYIPRSGVAEFRLFFTPMPKDTKIFDLVEGKDEGMFRILGIHDAKSGVKIPVAKEEIDPEEVSEHLFRKGTAVVCGKIERYVRDWNASVVFFNFATFEQAFVQPFAMSRTCAAVEADGSFRAELTLDHPVWATVGPEGAYPEIPIYVRPGDTLGITIKGARENGLEVEYACSNPKGCYANLLRHQNVPVVYYGWERLTHFGTVLDNDAFLEKVGECVEENMRLCDYVAWKHKLSPWETHLLKNRQRLLLTEHNLLMASRLFGEKVTVPRGRMPVKEDYAGYDYSAYKVLGVLPADDPSLAILPQFASFPYSLDLTWPVSNASTYAFFDNAPGRSGSSSMVRAELEKDSLQVDALRGLTEMPGVPWVVQAFLASKVCRLPDGLTPAQRAEVVDRLSALLPSPYFKRKIKELDSLSVRSESRVFEMPEGEAREDMEQLLKDHGGRYVQVVCFSSPGKDAGFFLNPDVENILTDYGQDCPDVQFVAIVNRDAYSGKELNGAANKINMPFVYWIDGEQYLGLQQLFRFSGSGKQLTFDRNGLAFKNALDMRDETSFRQRVRRILEAEKSLR